MTFDEITGSILDFILDRDPKMAARNKLPIKPEQTLEMASRKFFNSPREAIDLYQYTLMANYALKNGLSYSDVERILIKVNYG